MSEARLLAAVVVHTLAIYVFLVVVLATTGRRQMAQLTLVDYLTIALLGSAVETGLYLGGGSFPAGITSAATLLAANRGLRALAHRSSRLHRLLVGVPIVVVSNGRIVRSNLRRVHLSEGNLLSAIRMRGYDTLDAVRVAVVEPNGSVSVVPRGPGEQPS